MFCLCPTSRTATTPVTRHASEYEKASWRRARLDYGRRVWDKREAAEMRRRRHVMKLRERGGCRMLGSSVRSYQALVGNRESRAADEGSQ